VPLRPYQQSAVDAALNHYKYRGGVHGYVTAPGGSGKSHLIAAVAEGILALGAGKVVVLARSEKLLTQNHSKFSPEMVPYIGMYCAGLGVKDATRPITIASIQSIASVVMEDVAAILVDECDEINTADEESQYASFFTACGSPTIIGFTATPFRTASGGISWGEEIINIPIAPLFDGGHLTRPTNKVGTMLDLSDVPVRLGDYAAREIEEVYSDPSLLRISVEKIKQYSAERSCVLIFCQSHRHADILANAMEHNAMPATIVSGDTDKEELGCILNDFADGRVKYLINVNLITRGYDIPPVDMIVVLRATKSKRLWEQMLYRGTRLHPGKVNFLVLDMGNNFITHGPLGSPHVAARGREVGAYIGKICPVCEDYVPKSSMAECPDCHYQFPEADERSVSHSSRADTTSDTVYDGPKDERYEVVDVTYKRHKGKAGKPDTLRVEYWCGFGKYGNACEWLSVMPEASQWARDKAKAWFKFRGNEIGDPAEYTFDDLLWHTEQLRKPTYITIDHSGQYPRVVGFEWPKVATATESLEHLLGEDSL